MDEEPIQSIRVTKRHQMFLNRKKLKDEETDVRRSLDNFRLKPADVTTIANKLKTKASVSVAELKLLQNALVDDPKNVEVVLNTHGALRGLVRELTGSDVNKQVASCGCLCNLALGNSRACCTVAKAAGAYLVAALDSLTAQLATTCAWALGNLAGSGPRASDVIIAQGALAKLCDVTRGDTRDAALYALTHIVYVSLEENLMPEHVHRIFQALSQIELTTDASRLLFYLSCHNDYTPELITETYLEKIVQKLTVRIDPHINVCKNNKTAKSENKCCDLVYLIRFLANMNNIVIYDRMLEYFISNNLVEGIKKLLETNAQKSLWWLLGNMLNFYRGHVFFKELANNLWPK